MRNLVIEEKRAFKRVVPNIPIHVASAGNDNDQTRLMTLERETHKFPKAIINQEATVLPSRLDTLNSKVPPIPKGVDPAGARANRHVL